MDIQRLVLPAIVTLGALIVYFGLGIGVGVARFKYKISPPQTTGNETFERVYRAHQNTLEQIVIFIPALWLYSIFVDPNLGAILGAVGLWGALPMHGVTTLKRVNEPQATRSLLWLLYFLFSVRFLI